MSYLIKLEMSLFLALFVVLSVHITRTVTILAQQICSPLSKSGAQPWCMICDDGMYGNH